MNGPLHYSVQDTKGRLLLLETRCQAFNLMEGVEEGPGNGLGLPELGFPSIMAL